MNEVRPFHGVGTTKLESKRIGVEIQERDGGTGRGEGKWGEGEGR